ncbi:SusC/RagA family TonB-linked outer membrane protein [Mucilaginibacter corticis]|uniref:SusC/RagA family TonB-linked outer membrane protein n=1 Tax=Mucilaginibacter corticis TaxID=2597670 RepID=A0A556M947_9SPHI|nr:SusC/RagA family TonB-linked outer membrane protein [Mucilaginibacter corticis]TSJ36423.1 SusC/RagA family TonB-linked outer membrane protein [Mucilaginibacter corticis]
MQINLRAKTPGKQRRFTSKLFLVMKITTFLIIIASLQVSAAAFSQQITLSEKNAPIAVVLNKIQEQSGYQFFYNSKALSEAGKVTVRVNNVSVQEALDLLFKDQPFTYAVEHNTIVVKAREPSIVQQIAGLLKLNTEISGMVTDSLRQPLIGATVNLAGPQNYHTSTDSRGVFRFPSLPPGDYQIVITYVGYQPLDRSIKVSDTKLKLLFIMRMSTGKLDEILVTGYNSTTRRLSTGAISKVSGAQIEQQPVSDPILGLEGRVPGLFITQTAGNPGATLNVVIRGQNSLSALSQSPPLYIIDGIPFASGPVENAIGGHGIQGFNPLNTINPSDIESIDVLKDADATAIYGSRGANGVIVITTKKGKMGDTKVNLELSDGFGEATHLVPMATTAQYLALRRQAFANDNVTPTAVNAPDLFTYSQNAYTDYGHLLIGNTSHQRNAAVSVSGGDAFTQFLFGANLRHESTIFDAANANNAEQFHLNLQHKSHDSKFSAGINVSYNLDHNSLPAFSLTANNYSLPPNYPLYNSDGSLYFGTGYTNPLAGFNANFDVKSNNLIANANIRYTIIPGLDLSVNAGYNLDNVYSSDITPSNANNPAFNYSPSAIFGNNYIKTYIVEPKLNYTYVSGKSRITALIGGTWQETQTVQPYWIYTFYTNPQLVTSLSSAKILFGSSGYSDYRYDSGYGRLEYAWNDEFLASANIRRDGSSRFGADKQFGTFGSGAAAWIFTKENLVKEHLPWLSFGKFKASYGTGGEDGSAVDYAYESTYYAGGLYGSSPTINPTLGNNLLQWELTKKLDIAMDLGFFQDRILFSIAAYRNRTSHLLGSTPLPSQTGFVSLNANLPDGAVVQNKGLEMELTTNNIKKKDFSWTTAVNFTLPQNKLLSFPDLLSSTYVNNYVVGKSLNSIYVYHFTGFKNGLATVQQANPANGPVQGIAANGKGDWIIAGNTDPRFYGGFNNMISFKGFQLDILFQAVSRKAPRSDTYFSAVPGMGYNVPKAILNLPFKATTSYGNAASNAYFNYIGSDAAVEDASFVRLKNVSLAYNFPASITGPLKLSGLQVYVHAQNLLTFTKFQGLDPETLSNGLPTVRMILAGLKTTF